MNASIVRGIVALIGMVYAAGMVIHFWHTFAVIAALIVLVTVCRQRSKPRVTVSAETLAEARRLQSYYSNRR